MEKADPQARLADVLAAISSANAPFDLAQTLRDIVEAATDAAGARYGTLRVIDPGGTQIGVALSTGFDDDLVTARRGRGFVRRLIDDPSPVRLHRDRGALAEAGLPLGDTPATLLGLPVRSAGTVTGHLYMGSTRDGEPFTAVDEERVAPFAVAAGLTIEVARHRRWMDQAIEGLHAEPLAIDLIDGMVRRLHRTGLLLAGAARLSQRHEAVERIHLAIGEVDAVLKDLRHFALTRRARST